MGEAPRYDILPFLGQKIPGYASQDCHAVMALCLLGTPVSFDRSSMASVSVSAAQGVSPRGAVNPLVLSDDLVHVNVDRQKASHLKTATVAVTGGSVRLLRDVLPGDWAMVWLVPTKPQRDALVARIRRGDAANRAEDGLRLVGRVHQVRKRLSTDPGTGNKNVTYTLQLVGFSELDAQLYYDISIATGDLMQQAVGQWLTRIGVDAEAWFAKLDDQDRKDNINVILPEILELVLGRGVSKDVNAGAGAGLSAGAGAGAGEDAPNAYVVPSMIGKLLGRPGNGVLAYAELLAPFIGVEGYQAKENDLKAFVPTRRGDLSGSFLPQFPTMINTPFWSVLSHFLNPAVNEMFTCLRPQPDGTVLPALVARQIPFTTDAFDASVVDDNVTRFTELPRWVIPDALIWSSDLGRSDATHVNLVHVYGSANDFANNMTVSQQIAESPPIRDDLDIMRSGPRPHMETVECAPDDQRGTARKWMELIADRRMGSHLTLNGTVECLGLPGPMAEGDNVEIDGMIFHLEGILDEYSCAADGNKSWRTILRLSNGVLASGDDSLHYYGIKDDDIESLEAGDPSSGGR